MKVGSECVILWLLVLRVHTYVYKNQISPRQAQVSTYTKTPACTYMYMHAYTHAHAHMHRRTCTHIHAHTYLHTQALIHTRRDRCWSPDAQRHVQMHRHPLTMTRTTEQCRVLDSHTGGEGAWPQCSCPGHWTTLEPPGALKVPGHGISGGQPGQSGCYPLICLQPPSGWVEGTCFHWTQGQGPGLAAHSPPHRA